MQLFYQQRSNDMPKKLEKALDAEIKKKGLKGKRARAYKYGTMRKTGWTPSTQKTDTGTKYTME